MPRYTFATDSKFTCENRPNVPQLSGIVDVGELVVPPYGSMNIVGGNELAESIRDITIDTGFLLNAIQGIHECFDHGQIALDAMNYEALALFMHRLRQPLASNCNQFQSCHAPNIPRFEGNVVVCYHDEVYGRAVELYEWLSFFILGEEYYGELKGWPKRFAELIAKHWDEIIRAYHEKPFPWFDENELRLLLSNESLFARRTKPMRITPPDRKGFRSTNPPQSLGMYGPLSGSQAELCSCILHANRENPSEALQTELTRRSQELWAVREKAHKVSVWFATQEEYSAAVQKLIEKRQKQPQNTR